MKISVYERIDDLPENFLSIMSMWRNRNLFLTSEWFECLLRHGMPSGLTPRIYTVSDAAGSPILVTVLAHDKKRRSLSGLVNFYTMEFQPIFVPSESGYLAPLRSLTDFIAAERPKWREVHLRNLKADCPANLALVTALKKSGFIIEQYLQYYNWYIRTEDKEFDQYYRDRPSRLKNTIKRRERTAQKEHDLHLEIYSGDRDVGHAIGEYARVYEASWKEPEQYPAFVENLIRICAKLKILRLGILYVDAVPAAAQLWITTAKRAVIYKLAYNEKYSRLSVGSILSKYMIEHALDVDNVSEIDYGIGNESYKKDWMNERREVVGVRAHNTTTIAGLVAAIVYKVKAKLRSLVGHSSNGFRGLGRVQGTPSRQFSNQPDETNAA